MPKSKKKTLKQYLPKTRKNQVILFIILFAVLGSIVIIARAATSVSDELLSTSNLAVGYTDAGTVTVERDQEGKVTSYTRPRAIDISKDGILYCTPKNVGTITQRQLSIQEQKAVDERIVSVQPTTITANETDEVSISDEPRVYVDGFFSGINGNTYTLSRSETFVTESIEYLEELCSVPGSPIPSGEAPDVILGDASISQSTDVARALFPKAYAGGVTATSGGGYFQVNTQHEATQNILMAGARQRSGLPATQATTCLVNAAREWTRVMVSLGYIRHTSQLSVLPEKYCGAGGWTKLGENVGVSGLSAPNNDEASTSSSTSVFNAFMASEGHRRNILDRQFTHHGVGSYTSPDGKKVYVTQIFWAGRALPK